MEAGKKTLIIIPAFNEAEHIGEVARRAREAVPFADTLVVDDGSGDRTARYARQAGAITISLLQNMGYGVALQTGYKYAMKRGYRRIVQMDGDGQHDPASLPRAL